MAKPKGFFKEGGKTKPFHERKGITEDQMKISVRGNNDTIVVDAKKPTGGMKGNREILWEDIEIPYDLEESKRQRLFIIANKKDKNYEKIANDMVRVIDRNGKKFHGTRREMDIMELTGGLETPFRKAIIE